MTDLREIRATFDDRTIVVYQAYGAHIAEPAVTAQKFVPPFSLNRMTWIKPSFLWMMERCGWASKAGQEHVLAIRITRAGWEEALSQAALSSGDTSDAPVVVQWDPERNLRGHKLNHRSIQVGLGRAIVGRYVDEWTVAIEDVTPIVKRMKADLDDAERLLPVERVYPAPEAIRRRLGMA